MAKKIYWIFCAIPITSEVHKEEIQGKSRVFSLWCADPKGPWTKPHKQLVWLVCSHLKFSGSLQVFCTGPSCCPTAILRGAAAFFSNSRGFALCSLHPPAVLAYLLLLQKLLASSWCRFISSVISSASRRHHSGSSGRLRLEIGKGITKSDKSRRKKDQQQGGIATEDQAVTKQKE